MVANSSTSRILVVEDDHEMSDLVAKGLRAEGYEVTVVTNGMDALMAAASGTFAAATIDVMMPEMTGFEVCRHLRNHGNSLPVLLVTARDAIEDRVFGLDSGADDYLTKPFAFAEFAARVRALVRRDSAAPKIVVVAGNVSLDTATMRASVANASISFSTKEFLLLRFLIVHIDRAVSRAEILEEVWGTINNIDPTIVDQYIKYVRRKLESTSADVIIRTVRGIGYELRAREGV
ncbi:response regulator transcription factor [Lacisediminihabitans changchengi]|uniref:Response regulator transcription factor n=1 Tax=Lacisediminihabitans changchengi TaxID=2787634 RepID=A0A934SM37_9MICO|nr:response regulator transcription factor [Lacisediminihabitans changchengi]MBK4346986.1 response regulator transcription factor [Lacisediminihabitans changchengi]MBK4347891.1 response regulator transcription factor [Lacisediminihabitans changchengi]